MIRQWSCEKHKAFGIGEYSRCPWCNPMAKMTIETFVSFERIPSRKEMAALELYAARRYGTAPVWRAWLRYQWERATAWARPARRGA